MATSKYITLPSGKRVKRQTAAANHPSGKSTKSTSKKKTTTTNNKKIIKKVTKTTSSPKSSSSSSKAPKYTMPKAYESALEGQINDALNKVTNREDFNYDPLQDASYQALAKIYNQQGAQAARDTLGDMAALNGGLGSSAATSAAAQQRSTYNQQLAAQIPALREQAYNEYLNNYNMNVTALDALMGRDESLYGRYRDTVGDQQFRYGTLFDTWRANVEDKQWNKSFNQSVKEFNKTFGQQKKNDYRDYTLALKELQLKKNSLNNKSSSKKKSGGGGSGGGYYSSSSSGSSNGSGSKQSKDWKSKASSGGNKTASQAIIEAMRTIKSKAKG